jgi:uncharacterized membrane protein
MITPLPARRIGVGVWALAAGLALALALLPAKILLAAAGALVALGLVLADPVFGVYLTVLSVPVQELVHLPGGLSVTQASVALMAAGWGLRLLTEPRRELRLGPGALLWAGMLAALLLSSSLTPFSLSLAVKETARWVAAFLVWLAALNCVTRRWHVLGLLACMLLAPAAAAALGVWQFWSGSGPDSFRIDQALPYVRAYSTFGTPNAFAGYLNMAWPLALALAAGASWRLVRRADQRPTTNDQRPTTPDEGRRTKDATSAGALERWSGRAPEGSSTPTPQSTILNSQFSILNSTVLWCCAGLLLAALALTFSRGAWLGALAGLAAMLLALGGRVARAALALLVAGLLVLGLGGVNLLPQPLQNRLASITRSFSFFDPSTVEVTPENYAVVERMAQMRAGWRMFAGAPLTGVGPGNFTPAYARYTAPPWYGSRGHAHNYYLNIAAQTGLVGLLAYLALVGGMGALAVARVRRARAPLWRWVGFGCCGMIAAVAGHNLFENLHALNMGVQLAAVWALVCLPLSMWEQHP